ncbi:MAG: hypothetical protein ACK5H1_04845 [Tenacibaculum sp.]
MTTDYVGIPCGTLNCPQHDSDRSKKPIEGETYYYMESFKWNDKRDAFTISGDGYIKYNYPNISEEKLLKKFNLASIKGYYGKRTFYAPVYDKAEQVDSFPDYRNTLFCKSNIITDKKGEIQLDFSTSDVNSKFIGVIEGVSGNGQLGRQIFGFGVRKKNKNNA